MLASPTEQLNAGAITVPFKIPQKQQQSCGCIPGRIYVPIKLSLRALTTIKNHWNVKTPCYQWQPFSASLIFVLSRSGRRSSHISCLLGKLQCPLLCPACQPSLSLPQSVGKDLQVQQPLGEGFFSPLCHLDFPQSTAGPAACPISTCPLVTNDLPGLIVSAELFCLVGR